MIVRNVQKKAAQKTPSINISFEEEDEGVLVLLAVIENCKLFSINEIFCSLSIEI